MNVLLRGVDDLTIVELTGKILGGTESEPLRRRLDELVARGERNLLINLSGVPWMNSAGLGILLSAYSRLRDLGGTVRFCGARKRVRGILRTTKLLTVLEVADDEGAGIRQFGVQQS